MEITISAESFFCGLRAGEVGCGIVLFAAPDWGVGVCVSSSPTTDLIFFFLLEYEDIFPQLLIVPAIVKTIPFTSNPSLPLSSEKDSLKDRGNAVNS